jgi:two-component system, NarL family, invasion response regulator UvrY
MVLVEECPLFLIIEDSATVRASIRLWLKANFRNCLYLEAANGPEGLATALAEEPHVVLVDIELPQMNGLEVVRRLKVQKPAMQIIVLSMHDEESVRREAFKAGADAYVAKANVADELLGVVTELLGRVNIQ